VKERDLLGWKKGGGLEGFHTYIHLRGRVGGIYLARDI